VDQKLRAINGQLKKIQKQLKKDSSEYESMESIQKEISGLKTTAKKWIEFIEPNISDKPSFYIDQPIDDAIEIVQNNSFLQMDIDFVKSENVPRITGEYGLIKQAVINLLTSCQVTEDATSWVGIRIDGQSQPPKSLMKKESEVQYFKIDFSSDAKLKHVNESNEHEIEFLFDSKWGYY